MLQSLTNLFPHTPLSQGTRADTTAVLANFRRGSTTKRESRDKKPSFNYTAIARTTAGPPPCPCPGVHDSEKMAALHLWARRTLWMLRHPEP